MECVLTLGGDTEVATSVESGYSCNIYGQLPTIAVPRYHISKCSRSEPSRIDRSEGQRIAQPLRHVLPHSSASQ